MYLNICEQEDCMKTNEPQFIGILHIDNFQLWEKIKDINVLYLKVFIHKEVYTIGNIELKKIDNNSTNLCYEITGDLLVENLKNILDKKICTVKHFNEDFPLGRLEFIEFK